MKLNTLIGNVPGVVRRIGDMEVEIGQLCVDSRKSAPGALFFCTPGLHMDAHDFAPQAVAQGAVALVVQRILPLDVPQVQVEDVRAALSYIAAEYYGRPAEKLMMLGITGTKGKTTTSYMMRSILTAAGRKSGLIGTICNYIGDERIPTERTTPEANVIQPLLKKMVDAGIGECVMEVSSQGLNLDRVGGCEFAVGLFTNLSPDHIGPSEHANMEEYAAAKAKLFGLSRFALVNRDNDWSEYMIARAQATVKEKLYTFGMSEGCDFRAVGVVKHPEGVEYDCEECGEVKAHIVVPIPGRFSVYNSLGAYAAMRLIGIDPATCAEGLSTVAVAGKAEVVPTGRDFTVIIDYAHNPDSFINIITTVKEFAKRTVFLFGCGGDRNRPRALMGETAGKYADFSIITSDNPRSEDPASIVADLEAGLKPTGGKYVVIVDRREAIHWAIAHAQPGDVIILAGKGHETYQILKDRTIHFDEREVVREALAEL